MRTKGKSLLSRAGPCCLLVLTVLLGSGPTAVASTPPAERQLGWLVEASSRTPISAAELAAHVDPTLLAAAGGPAGFNATLAELAPLAVRQTLSDTPTSVRAVLDSELGPLLGTLTVDSTGLLAGLTLSPWAPTPRSWPELDTRLHALAPQVSFAASVIDPRGGCRVVHGVNANTQRPLGSAFKLYVLGALGQAVADHRASWDQQLAIHEEWKSLPSGVLQNEPAGTELSLRQYADEMISISDNTAADHLIHFLGQNTVAAQLFRFHNQNPGADIPFLTTRELFALKSVRYPTLADHYLALPRPLRVTALPGLDAVPYHQLGGWTQPEKIDQLEWFGSPSDICHAFAGLWQQNSRPGLSPIGDALSINDGGLQIPAPTVWFKGGSEPGVLTYNYLVHTTGGRLVVASVMLGDPRADLPLLPDTAQAMAMVRAAVRLAG